MDGPPEFEQDGLEVVKHLLEAGCDVNYPNHAGLTPLHQANRLGHSRMIRSGGQLVDIQPLITNILVG